MDLARPQGVIFDESFRIDLLTPSQREMFTQDAVQIRGITTGVPLTIFHSPTVIIPPSARRAPDDESWEVVEVDINTLKELHEVTGTYLVDLPSKPVDPTRLVGRAEHSAVRPNGSRHPNLVTYLQFSPLGTSRLPESRMRSLMRVNSQTVCSRRGSSDLGRS